ncbi:MAG: hypothetical protein GX134_01745 [candidate division WS1 bacterium]|jgi:DNA-binding IclR family transcriptional regulator|nr:hypothetical protein [candidate division WS1 bacterium]
MSTKLFRNWHSGNMALGLRALLYLMDDPSQATTLLGIARRLRIDSSSAQACLDELVECGFATASEGECGGTFYRLSSAPSMHALAARVRHNARDYEGFSPALRPLLRQCAQRATGMRGSRPSSR